MTTGIPAGSRQDSRFPAGSRREMNFPAKIPPGSRQEIVPEGNLGGNPGGIFLSWRDLPGSCRDNGIPARIPARFSFPGGIPARFPLPDGIPAGNKFPGKNLAGILTRNSLGGESRRESWRDFLSRRDLPGSCRDNDILARIPAGYSLSMGARQEFWWAVDSRRESWRDFRLHLDPTRKWCAS